MNSLLVTKLYQKNISTRLNFKVFRNFLKKKSIKLLTEENNFYSLGDGEMWLKSIFKLKKKIG